MSSKAGHAGLQSQNLQRKILKPELGSILTIFERVQDAAKIERKGRYSDSNTFSAKDLAKFGFTRHSEECVTTCWSATEFPGEITYLTDPRDV